ncbi:hypothetical protein NX059_008686 [Plenodomus lindquistii]|nr:hypothetical protein NX059_008686 [Plenodomus lindquistii]
MLLFGANLHARTSRSAITRLASLRRSQSTFAQQERYWTHIPRWKDVFHEDFVSHRWQIENTVKDNAKLYQFLSATLPDVLEPSKNPLLEHIKTRDDFIVDAISALKLAPMAVRLTPHILARVDWERPLDDPIRRQFLPLKSGMIPDHKHMKLDSLNEQADSPVPGLVHRYPGRALFLATSICPVYCRFCTRSYAVGASTDTVAKKPQKPSRRRWEVIFKHIEQTQELQDIVLSGGDIFYLEPQHLREIVERLLSIPHMRRIRLATKGLSVAPGRFLDTRDDWMNTLIDLSNQGRKLGKQVCVHTHINHASEITWVTEMAAQRLFEHGVIVRNQSVLMNGVNNDRDTLGKLLTRLADINIQPYYVYQCDMVQGIEDLRTPLQEIIDLDKWMRGRLTGFMMPSFVVDLPGGGGKRLVSTYESYENGVAEYKAPGLLGEKGTTTYTYYDPKPVLESELAAYRLKQESALHRGETLEQFAAAAQPKLVPEVTHSPEPSTSEPIFAQISSGERQSPKYFHPASRPKRAIPERKSQAPTSSSSDPPSYSSPQEDLSELVHAA